MRTAAPLLLMALLSLPLSWPLSLSAATLADGEKLDNRFGEMDANHDGSIDRAEFRAMMDKRFDEMDTNHDGRLSKEEMLIYRHLLIKERAARNASQ